MAFVVRAAVLRDTSGSSIRAEHFKDGHGKANTFGGNFAAFGGTRHMSEFRTMPRRRLDRALPPVPRPRARWSQVLALGVAGAHPQTVHEQEVWESFMDTVGAAGGRTALLAGSVQAQDTWHDLGQQPAVLSHRVLPKLDGSLEVRMEVPLATDTMELEVRPLANGVQLTGRLDSSVPRG